MGKVTVVNKYEEPNHIYCGRGSVFGNPYHMYHESQRDSVCESFNEMFNDIMLSKPDNSLAIGVRKLVLMARTQDVNLGCFCAPKRCHCDTIKAYIDKQLEK